jgi:glycosyltransferase involved in cell wall biosynthesis
VITSGAGGAQELTEPGVNALHHTPGDARSLARAIETLARDAHLRAQLGAAARTAAEQRFTRRRLVDEFTPIYQRLAATH